MFPRQISTKYQDLKTLLDRIKVIDDIIMFNTTLVLGPKYTQWQDRHVALLEELEFMIKEDLEK